MNKLIVAILAGVMCGGVTTGLAINGMLEYNYRHLGDAQTRENFKPVLAAVTAEALSSKTYTYVDWVTATDSRFEKCMRDVVTYMNVSELRLVLYTGCPVMKVPQ